MAEQLWKGRFSKAVDSRVNDFNSSIRFDQRMIAQDMRGSGVHAAMLAKQGIISEKDCEDILNGLASIADDLASGKLEIDPNAEDVHTFVEQTLTARIGDAGKRLHTGRSRNDQVALDIRLTLRDYSHTLQAYIVELIKVICRKASENTTAVMPGYTHLQRAQPITFGHALMAYASMLLRDLQRFEDATARMDAQCPLGSGALAGFAGGKGNEPVAVFSGHTCIIQSKLLALPDIGIKIFLILRINKVVVSESLRTVRHSLKHSDDFILCLLCEGIKLNILVFLIKALGLVILQRSKHLAALNVMTVDNQIVTFSNIAILLHIRRS